MEIEYKGNEIPDGYRLLQSGEPLKDYDLILNYVHPTIGKEKKWETVPYRYIEEGAVALENNAIRSISQEILEPYKSLGIKIAACKRKISALNKEREYLLSKIASVEAEIQICQGKLAASRELLIEKAEEL